MNEVLLGLYVALQAGDIYTTHAALQRGAREVNPILAKLFERFNPLAVMVVTKAVTVYLLWSLNVTWVTAAACAVYVAVVTSNLRVLLRKSKAVNPTTTE